MAPRLKYFFSMLIFLFCAALISAAPEPDLEILVRLHDASDAPSIRQRAENAGAELVRKAHYQNLYLFRARSLRDKHILMSDLSRDPAVAHVQKNNTYTLSGTFPNDLGNILWNLHNTGGYGRIADADIDAPEGWDHATGSRDVVVAVIDSGILSTHPDLTDNLWKNPLETAGNGIDDDGNGFVDDIIGWNFADSTNDCADEVNHGTPVAGIIGAVGNNGRGVAGVNWRVSIMSLKCFKTNQTDDLTLINAIDYAVNNGARVINASWGDTEFSQEMFDAVQRAGAAGILFAAASGNDGLNLGRVSSYPAAFPLGNVISVGSMNQTDRISGFSNVGLHNVHLLAPGESCRTTSNNGDYAYKNGTSFATPHVSGAAALLLSAFPGAGHDFLRGKIQGSVERTALYEGSCMTGGRLNIHRPFLADSYKGSRPGPLDLRLEGFNGAVVEFDLPSTGALSLYDVRVHDSPVTSGTFFASRITAFEPAHLRGVPRMKIRLNELDAATTYHLAMRFLDEAGNYSPVSPSISFQTEDPRVLYAWNSGDADGWTAAQPWHLSPFEPFEGDACWGVSDWQSYPAGINALLSSPAMNFIEETDPILEFFSRHHMEPSVIALKDYGALEMSLDNGSTWRVLREYPDWNDPWKREWITLEGAGGKSAVRIRFRFVSDAETDPVFEKGWFVDRIRVLAPDKQIARPCVFFAEPFRRFERLNTAPLYVEEGAGWTSIASHNATNVFGKEARQARGNPLDNGVAGRAFCSPYFPASGRYRVSASWGLLGNALNVSFVIRHQGGETVIIKDQDGMGNPHIWHDLGEYRFASGRDAAKGSAGVDEKTVTGPAQTSYQGMVAFDVFRFELLEEDDLTPLPALPITAWAAWGQPLP